MWWREESVKTISKKSHFRNTLALIASKMFGENDTEALVISKSLKFP